MHITKVFSFPLLMFYFKTSVTLRIALVCQVLIRKNVGSSKHLAVNPNSFSKFKSECFTDYNERGRQ